MFLNITKKEKPKELRFFEEFSAVVHNDKILYIHIPGSGWIGLSEPFVVAGLHDINRTPLREYDKPVKILSINVEEI